MRLVKQITATSITILSPILSMSLVYVSIEAGAQFSSELRDRANGIDFATITKVTVSVAITPLTYVA